MRLHVCLLGLLGLSGPWYALGSPALVGSSRQFLALRRLCTVIPYFIEWLFQQRTSYLPRIRVLKSKDLLPFISRKAGFTKWILTTDSAPLACSWLDACQQ